MKALKKSTEVEKNIEDVLALVGDFGPYQKFIIVAAMIPISFITSVVVYITIFQTMLPDKYWCDPPGRELTNFTQVEWWNMTVPKNKDGNFEKCLQYDFDVFKNSTQISVIGVENKTEKCTQKWAFDESGMRDTLPTTMNLFCEDEIYASHLLALRSLGSVVGTTILPIIGDVYTGRKMIFLITCGIHIVTKILLLVVPFNPARYFIRFFEGLSFPTDYNIPFVIGLELMKTEKRTLVTLISLMVWIFGMCFASFVSWLIPYWWYLEVFMLVISSTLILCWWALPNSPRWLLSKGKVNEAVEVLMKIGKVNGKKVERETLRSELMTINSMKEEKIHIKEILKHKRVFFHAILLILYTTIVYAVYYCTVLNVNVLPENIFLSFFVITIFEIPSALIAVASLHYLGRRFTAVSTMIFSMIFTIAAPYCLGEREILLLVVSMIKFFITQGMNLVYVITCEAFPTSLRSFGLGVVTTCGAAGCYLSVYIVGVPGNEANRYWILCGIQVVGVVVALLLPETIGLPLPQTFPEANLLGINRPFFKWVHKWNKHKFSVKNRNINVELDEESKSDPDMTNNEVC